MSFGAELGYEDQPRRPLSEAAAAARVRSWRLAPVAIGWLGGGVVLLVLGVVARRPDVVAIGAPLLIGLAWGTSRRPARVPSVRLTGDDQPTGSTGTVSAEVEIAAGRATDRARPPRPRPRSPRQ